jgi:hypothetical protein
MKSIYAFRSILMAPQRKGTALPHHSSCSASADGGRTHHPKAEAADLVERMVVDAEVRARVVPIVEPGAAAQHPRLLAAGSVKSWIVILVPAPLPHIARQVRHLLQAVSVRIHTHRRGTADAGLRSVRSTLPPFRTPRISKAGARTLSRPLPLLLIRQAHFETKPGREPAAKRRSIVPGDKRRRVTGQRALPG